MRFALAGGTLVLATAGLPGTAAAWGFAAHRVVHAKAIGTLPPPLRTLFEGNAAYVVEHSIDPDLWVIEGRPGEAPNHFLDLDAFGEHPFSEVPRVEAEHLARHGAEAGAKGRLPWRVGEVHGELVAAFRARDPARVLERAAVLGHYVGDAHVPLHSATNYDGQLTGQHGVHARWESRLFERFERQFEAAVEPAPAHRVGDAVALIFDTLLEGYTLSLELLAADKASAGPRDYAETPEDDRYDDRYYSRLYEREGATLRARLSASASNLGSLWLSAWEEAGRPVLDWSFRIPYVRGQTRSLLVSLDGSPAPLLDDAVARGLMPNLARLRRRGASASGSLAPLPAKTAASHASLFTGAWPDRHGIAGNKLSLPEASVLDATSGYLSSALRAEPVWVTAARQGLHVTTLLATQTYPFSPYLEERRFRGNFGRSLTLIDGYNALPISDIVLTARDLALRPAAGWVGGTVPAGKEFDLSVAGVRVDGLLTDDPADPVRGFDTLLLAVGHSLERAIRLKPRSVSDGEEDFQSLLVPTKDGEVGVFFRLFALSPDASEVVLYQAEAGLLTSNRSLVAPAATRASGGFVGDAAGHLYRVGALGPPLWAGGDGTAERRYLETQRLVARQFARLAAFAARRTRWDLLVAYLPLPDEPLHAWLGFLDPALPGHDAALAARVRPLVEQSLGIVDGYLGELERLTDEREAVLAVASDHGLVAVNRIVRLNAALEKAGLLSLDARGAVDLARTRAVYFPGNSGYFLINRASRPGGIVRPEEEEDVRRRLVAALEALRDPETKQPLVTQILDPRTSDPELALGGSQGGDLYFDLAPGYYPSSELRGELVSPERPRGEHLLDPGRPEMQAAFVIAGPGVATGTNIGPIRQIDVAPTLCALLGIDPPAQASGRVLTEALARRVSAPAPGP